MKLTYFEIGLHPRILTEGFDVAKNKALEVLESIKIPVEVKRENLLDVARTSLKTKVKKYCTLFYFMFCYGHHMWWTKIPLI